MILLTHNVDVYALQTLGERTTIHVTKQHLSNASIITAISNSVSST